ncbi:hypothetical protein Tco_0653244 [Tanacetum coccineum]|uniref:Reverse transcriptase domain-containing protein n=1 Tax=Tanacetum coccineum TaxID=301880 RepID=A0ABQ4X0B2_9ASTR
MRPPGFNQPNVQTNQNRYQGTNPNFNQNRGGNFNQNRQNQVYQAPPYQTPTNQPPINQVLPYQPPTNSVLKTDFESYVKANDAILKNVQNQGQNLQNQMANVTSLLTSLCDNFKNSASTSNSGTLPSQTVTNPRQQINAITTRSGKILEEPSIPLVPSPDVSKPQKEPEQNPETSTEKVQNPNLENTAHVPPPGEEDSIFMELPKPKAKKTVNLDPNPNSNQSRLPYPERMKVRGHDKPSAQYSRFLKMFKQLRLEIGLKDALVEMPKFNKWSKAKLEDPGKFLIPCALQELNRTSALADISSYPSINLLPSFYRQELELEALLQLMTRELANQKEFCSWPFLSLIFQKNDPFSGSTTNNPPPSSSPMKTSDNFKKFTDEFAPLDSLPPGKDDLTLKKDLHEVNFQDYSNPLFEFDDNFKSSNVNPLFDENDKDAEIKSFSSFTLTSQPNNPTSPTLTGEKICSWKTPMFFSLVRFVWKMMTRIAIRKKIICLLATYLHKTPKLLSRPQEVEEIKEKEDEVSSDVPIHTIVMPMRITFDNPIDFNDHFTKPKDLKKDLTISFDSTTESSILPPPLLDSDSPLTAELSASITLNSLGNEDKVFKPGILVYHAIHDKNLVTLEENLKENIPLDSF